MEYRDHENFQLAFSITKWQDMKKKTKYIKLFLILLYKIAIKRLA